MARRVARRAQVLRFLHPTSLISDNNAVSYGDDRDIPASDMQKRTHHAEKCISPQLLRNAATPVLWKCVSVTDQDRKRINFGEASKFDRYPDYFMAFCMSDRELHAAGPYIGIQSRANSILVGYTGSCAQVLGGGISRARPIKCGNSTLPPQQ